MDILGLIDVPTWLIMLLVTIALYTYYMTCTHGTFKKMGVKGPKPIPILGNALYMARNGVIKTTINGYTRFKKDKMYGVYEGRTPVLTITDVDLMHDVMVKQFNCFANRRKVAVMDQTGIDSVMFNVRDNTWKEYRSLLKPTLNTSRLKAAYPKIDVILMNLLNVLREKNSKEGDIEISEVLGCFCMDVIAEIGFEVDANSLRNPKHPFIVAARRVIDVFGQRSFGFELFAPPFLKNILDFFGIMILPKKEIYYLRNFTSKALTSRLGNAQGTTQTAKDIFQYMIDNSVMSPTPTKGRVLSLEEIHGSSLVYFLAGYDTSAKGLFYALFTLAMHPDCYKRAQKEVDDELQGEFPNPTNVTKLKYLDLCIKESNRIYPLGFYVERCCSKDCTVGGVNIPKGMVIRLPIAGIHFDPEFNTNPEQYDPERFNEENMKTRHPMSYMPFGLGPRGCFGEPLATLLIRVALAGILQEFDVQPCSKSIYPIRIIPLSDINPEHGLWLSFKPRK